MTDNICTISIPVVELTKRITAKIEVTGMNKWRIRVKVAIAIIRFAIWIMGIKGDITVRPMRMSVNKDDPGYHPMAQSHYLAFLNGVKVENCFTADEEKGYVWRHKTDENGRVIVDKAKDEIVTEQLFGHVEIRRVK